MRRTARLGTGLGLAVAALLLAAGPAQAATGPQRPHPHRKPWPVTVTVQTVPALAGVRFSWDGVALVTDSAGRAGVTAEHNFAPHTLALVATPQPPPGHRYRFVRWAGQRDPEQAYRTTIGGLPQRANYTVTAGFAVQYLQTFRFRTGGEVVDPARIGRVVVTDPNGDPVNVPPASPAWLDATVPVHRASRLVSQPATFSVRSVEVDGSNVVDAGRQLFVPARGTPVVVDTKFFDLTVRGRRVLFDAPAGRGATVVSPDGSRTHVVFGPGGTATLARLPRGAYRVELDAAGTSQPSEVSLSRDATVSVPVATPGTLAGIAIVGLSLAAGLIVFGGRQRGNLAAAWRAAAGWARGRRPAAPATTGSSDGASL